MSQSRTVDLVVACTSSKTVQPTKPLQLRNIGGGDLTTRAARWLARLRTARRTQAVGELYTGPAWALALDLAKAASTTGYQPRLMVASAGLGLVGVAEQAPAYSATFSPQLPDTTPAPSAEWWAATTSRQLAAARVPVLCVLPAAYAIALAADLESAARSGRPCVVITSRTALPHLPSEVTAIGIPSSAAPALESTLRLMHLAAAVHAIRRCRTDRPLAAQIVGSLQLFSQLPDAQPEVRTRRTDAQVRQWIKQAVRRHSGHSQTGLLRDLRNEGFACEQARFASLYAEVKA